MKYNDLTIGQIEAIGNKLGGMEGIQNFLSGKTVVVSAETLNAIPFSVWKSIPLGTHKDADAYRKALKKGGYKIGDWGNDILGKPAFTVAEKEETIDLVKVTVAELGFKNGATYKEICDAAASRGLKKCPNEVGPALRLAYTDQPAGEWLRIAMDPIAGSDGDLYIFDVVHDCDGRWLYGDYGHPGSRWGADYTFVFRLRK